MREDRSQYNACFSMKWIFNKCSLWKCKYFFAWLRWICAWFIFIITWRHLLFQKRMYPLIFHNFDNTYTLIFSSSIRQQYSSSINTTTCLRGDGELGGINWFWVVSVGHWSNGILSTVHLRHRSIMTIAKSRATLAPINGIKIFICIPETYPKAERQLQNYYI